MFCRVDDDALINRDLTYKKRFNFTKLLRCTLYIVPFLIIMAIYFYNFSLLWFVYLYFLLFYNKLFSSQKLSN